MENIVAADRYSLDWDLIASEPVGDIIFDELFLCLPAGLGALSTRGRLIISGELGREGIQGRPA